MSARSWDWPSPCRGTGWPAANRSRPAAGWRPARRWWCGSPRRLMRTQDLLEGIAIRACGGDWPLQLEGLHYDSRAIQPGWAFVAIHGALLDGHDFIPQAVENGARLVISELPPPAAG